MQDCCYVKILLFVVADIT